MMGRSTGMNDVQPADSNKTEPQSIPPAPATLCENGFRLRSAGQPLEAAKCCQQALSIDANHAGAMHLMGLLSFDAGQYDHAVEWMARAVRHDPKVEYLNDLGQILQRAKRHEEALRAFDKAVQLKPDSAELWRNLGSVLVQLNRDNEALLSYQHALKLQPNDFDAASKGGVLLHRQQRWAEALACFDLCETLRPDQVPILLLRAIAHRGLGNYESYLADSQRAHALEPDNAEGCNNIGDAQQLLGREHEAIAWFDKALALLPENPTILTNKACAIGQMQRFEEADAIYSRIKLVAPNHAMAEWNQALLKLLMGDFAAGWAGREARWRVPSLSMHYPKFKQPMWRGEDTAPGTTLLVHVDEGLGDTIQFARYVPIIAARGMRVVLVVADALLPLLSGLTGVAQCLPLSAAELPHFDMHCPLSSLPFVLGTTLDTIPAATAYLPLPPTERVQAWERWLGPHDRPRIGLAWSGNITHKNDRNRSIPLQSLTRILHAGATFVSLQKDPRPADRTVLTGRHDIIDLTDRLDDFSETAALVSCLDLVITADTSIAHLAGALGRPTWIMLPFTPDYRWLLNREDSPWYSSVRLFRQDAARDYAPVLDRIRGELAAFVSPKA
jgi:tetratricopeptide (TPR) repeat protein